VSIQYFICGGELLTHIGVRSFWLPIWLDDFLVEKVIVEEVSLKMWTEPIPEM